jgi:gliding motility-associated-like protein
MKVYNRWGELVYESYDDNASWDGTYKGKDQPNDTYIYIVKVKSWLDQTFEKRGYINLIR